MGSAMAKKNVMLNVVFLNGAEGSVGTATGGASGGSGGSKYDAVMMDGMTIRDYPNETIPYTIDTSKMTNMRNLFYTGSFYNAKLKSIPKLDTSNVTDMRDTFNDCQKLTTIQELDMSSISVCSNIFANCNLLTYIVIKNLGKGPLGGKSAYAFSGATNWGTGSDENRQSLIDSLITYSYDRASNGMAATYISLSANTKALLTEEEIAQITAKGFTIS